jgi:hypothetical protein
MAERDLKKHLLETLVASKDREKELERLCDDLPSPDPDLWTAKDHVAHLAHDDEPAAEASQLWMLGVHEAAFSEDRSRAFGAYNLGCFYAKLGRAADALPHLTRSFELHADLKTWGRTDKDLDRIRQDPALQAALE